MKKLMFMLLIVGVAFGFAIKSESKASGIRGKIMDHSTLEAIPFAKIQLKDESGNLIRTVSSDFDGKFSFDNIAAGTYKLIALHVEYKTVVLEKVKVEKEKMTFVEIKLGEEDAKKELEEVEVKVYKQPLIQKDGAIQQNDVLSMPNRRSHHIAATSGNMHVDYNGQHQESYSAIVENGFKEVATSPLSTFSIDVDAASYSNVRRHLKQGNLPPKDAVRVEEFINYFSYDYPNPKGDDPFSITTEFSENPWNPKTKLVHIGLQGQRIETDNLPGSNLVFLIDVSGSMQQHNRLPLVKKSLTMLVENLNPDDRVAIVVYSGAAGEVLPSTPASEKSTILEAINRLEAGGSTAGGAGIKLAYKVAVKNLIKKGNNRVIICTDGDFNVGQTSDGEMHRLIEKERESGVFLTCLGYGMGNYKDSKLETLADRGNGNYAYIDDLMEAKKVLVNEMGATLVTIAKDVKLQIEFNPNVVKNYRLVGYENRLLNNEDFNDDKKDAGELGAGHSVTAIYEVELASDAKNDDLVDPLKYQERVIANNESEVLTVKFRYKAPNGINSKLISEVVRVNDFKKKASEDFNWSASVAMFAMHLRGSEYLKDVDLKKIKALAQSSIGKDVRGYRSEFMQIIALTERLQDRAMNDE
jgi:Ca-activated chloride channel family protein